ncbi:MAG: Inorganic pyrophosphatase [candidate division WS6 bacterium GW2011_GWA2_37_6]|uniref:Inorganic pyrophosphatase n=1 Tax=candidate division WS6 bacterium GW2011_GWA2_37_6 TaxID=1619087 RepID=A0A0G0K1F4_9BACT|nr:MAG: Inorganic pyrophosphatase [candidate division WS6 bacterium GW2011_GWA2_37_6]
MANIDMKPQRCMPNILHVLPPYANEEEGVLNVIIEINSMTINKYELITETGHLKLDRVGYSSLAYPFAYGAIPMTWDEDGDPLDIEIVNVTEPLMPGSIVEARIIGIMKFNDGGETDDKVIAVLSEDKRVGHIKSVADLGEQFEKETTYYWEHYKDLKKPGTGKVEGFFDTAKAKEIIKECIERYNKEYKPKMEESCCCDEECDYCKEEKSKK